MAVVAALQSLTPAFRRRTRVRRYRNRLGAVSGPMIALLLGFAVAGAISVAATTPAGAQSFTYNPRPPKPTPPPAKNDGQMLVQAVEVDYDYNNSRVSAVGNVQMFYNGTSVEADKVIYDQKTKRLHAEGNVRLKEADGKGVILAACQNSMRARGVKTEDLFPFAAQVDSGVAELVRKQEAGWSYIKGGE